jgi:hypothetical protein
VVEDQQEAGGDDDRGDADDVEPQPRVLGRRAVVIVVAARVVAAMVVAAMILAAMIVAAMILAAMILAAMILAAMILAAMVVTPPVLLPPVVRAMAISALATRRPSIAPIAPIAPVIPLPLPSLVAITMHGPRIASAAASAPPIARLVLRRSSSRGAAIRLPVHVAS